MVNVNNLKNKEYSRCRKKGHYANKCQEANSKDIKGLSRSESVTILCESYVDKLRCI